MTEQGRLPAAERTRNERDWRARHFRNNDKSRMTMIVGRFCETPWRLTQTPYNLRFVVHLDFVVHFTLSHSQSA
jgi:hypothetical protein